MPPSFSLSGQVRIVPSWTDSLSTTDVVDSVTIQVPLTLSNGTGPAQADAYWRDVRTVTGGLSDVFVASNLPLSIFGGSGSVNLDVLKVVYVRNLSATTAIQFNRDESTPISIAPNGVLMWSAPVSTTYPLWFGNANKDFEIANPGATGVTYEVVLVGVKA